MVKDIELPSLTEVVDGVIKQIWDKLLTVTVELVATTVPEVDPVLIDRLKVSADPLSKSYASVLTIVAIPVVAPVLTILNVPVRDASVKSEAVTVPPVV